MSDGENIGRIMARRPNDSGPGQEAPQEEAEERTAQPRSQGIIQLVETHPRGALITMLLLAVPYLLICTGMALMLVSGLLGSGGCGG